MSATISAQSLTRLVDAARQLNVEVAAPPVDGERVPLSELHAMWEAIAQRWGGDDLVPRVLGGVTPRDYGVMGFLCMSAPTVGDALRVMARHLRLYTDEPVVEVTGGRVTVRYTRPLEQRPGLWRATEATLGEVLAAARTLTGCSLSPVAVSFAHRAPADRRPLDAFFSVPVQWEAFESSLELSAEQLLLPLISADEKLHAVLAPVAGAALEQVSGAAESVVERTRQALSSELHEGAPTAAVVARKLSMSERTLRRRLAQEGLGFRALLEQTRVDLARRYVADPRVPLAEVSFVLGFSEPSAFHRAFKRWTGVTPATFRRER